MTTEADAMRTAIIKAQIRRSKELGCFSMQAYDPVACRMLLGAADRVAATNDGLVKDTLTASLLDLICDADPAMLRDYQDARATT